MKYLNAFASYFSSSSGIVMKLPKLLDIFSPATFKKPACSQYFTKGLFPKQASLCAISFSWCGKTKSTAPPCTSNCFPRYFELMAEHSMCQPGLPAPKGLGHEGSPSFAFFHNAKSIGFSFSYLSVSTRVPE